MPTKPNILVHDKCAPKNTYAMQERLRLRMGQNHQAVSAGMNISRQPNTFLHGPVHLDLSLHPQSQQACPLLRAARIASV